MRARLWVDETSRIRIVLSKRADVKSGNAEYRQAQLQDL
jgi:hypothetical protein